MFAIVKSETLIFESLLKRRILYLIKNKVLTYAAYNTHMTLFLLFKTLDEYYNFIFVTIIIILSMIL